MAELKAIASQIRRDILRMVHGCKSGHPGGSLGCTEFFTALYFKVMKHDPAFNMDAINEDVFFLSNGHISPVFYATLARSGYFDKKELATFRKINSRLQGHPATHEHLPGIRIASGSLGQGMSVALGAAYGQAKPHGARRGRSVHGRFATIEFEVRTRFVILERIAVKAGGYFLLDRGPGQKISRELFNGELIERQILVDGVDHPVTIKISVRAKRVVEIPAAVRVAGEVEPISSPSFAEVRGSEERVDQAFISVRARIINEGLHGARFRRQPEEVQVQTTVERAAVSFR